MRHTAYSLLATFPPEHPFWRNRWMFTRPVFLKETRQGQDPERFKTYVQGCPSGLRTYILSAPDPLKALIQWFNSEFLRRTAIVNQSRGPVDWVRPDSRVPMSEIMAKAVELGITRPTLDLQLWWARLMIRRDGTKVIPTLEIA